MYVHEALTCHVWQVWFLSSDGSEKMNLRCVEVLLTTDRLDHAAAAQRQQCEALTYRI